MQLREWQNAFQNTVLGVTPINELPLQQTLSRDLSVGIYANAYRERLHEALRVNFPALHQLLGDHDFAEMAYAFIAAQPPQTVSIRWFGADLPNYLRNTQPFLNIPAISEIACFEWALRHTIDAANGKRIGANFLHSLSEEQWISLRCDTHPSLTILHFDWNAPQIWHALDADEEPPHPTTFNSYWFIYRSVDLTTEWRSADAYEAEAIQLWTRGKNFAAICEFIEEKIGDAGSAINVVASFMRTWVEQGLLIFSPLPLRGEGLGVRANMEEGKNNADNH